MKYGDLCTGFGGASIGAKNAGLELAWGVERNYDIVRVARKNLGVHVLYKSILDCDPEKMERVDVLHASPPCPSFSVAKKAKLRGESSMDIQLAHKISEFIFVMRPNVFTLENVSPYRTSVSFEVILRMLNRCAYFYDEQNINAADFGVPQNRRRLILRACWGQFVPHLPPKETRTGWYNAIHDIIHTFPRSEFVPWQLRRMPSVDMNRPFIVMGQNARTDDDSPTIRYDDEPIATITATTYRGPIRMLNHDGLVYRLTPRAWARLQTFPDWYELPDDQRLASTGIGNACPPLMMEKIFRQLIGDKNGHNGTSE